MRPVPRVPEGTGPIARGPATAGRHVAGRFGRDPAEVRRARSVVRSSLIDWGLPQQVAALELAVSELVTNALVHGTGEIAVDLTAWDGTVRLDVSDRGGGADTPHIDHRARTDAPGGWGLQLVEQLSDAWGTASSATETRVWLVRSTGPQSSA